MGSRWEEHPTGPEERGVDQFGPCRSSVGLEAAELDLLRSAPDYDAEEMASVRPIGGWPTPLPAAERLEPPQPFTGWMPPNRIEPPARAASSPVEVAPRASVPPDAAAAAARTRFPEERTVALMAEDLLGRPLDEPESPAELLSLPVPGAVPRPVWSAVAGDGDLWDSAMPLLAEG